MRALIFIIAVVNTMITVALPNMGGTATDRGGTELALLIRHFDICRERVLCCPATGGWVGVGSARLQGAHAQVGRDRSIRLAPRSRRHSLEGLYLEHQTRAPIQVDSQGQGA